MLGVIQEAASAVPGTEIRAVGLASMAESGLFIDIQTGQSLSPFLPWFDTSAAGEADQLVSRGNRKERLLRTGIYPSYKISLAKILWLSHQGFTIQPGKAVWLSAADYILYRLTGTFATDPSLAGRTGAFRIDRREWDAEYLASLGLSERLFPPVLPSGLPAGTVRGMEFCSLQDGIPAAVCGHDHIVASFAAGLFEPGAVFDSLGTAETITGLLPGSEIGEGEYLSGLSFGCHVFPDRLYWLGGLSTSGAAIDWIRNILSDPPMDYSSLDNLLAGKPRPAGSLLFLPYLAGSGSPHTDASLRGAFLGLDSRHGLADLYQAVLSGLCCEMEFIRRAGEKITAAKVDRIITAGGGISSRPWMQIKADIAACPVELFPVQEATLLGAALLAGVGAGVYPDPLAALKALKLPKGEVILPSIENQAGYQKLFNAYCMVQKPYRQLQAKRQRDNSSPYGDENPAEQ